MRIACDVDGVILDLATRFLEMYYGENRSEHEYTRDDWSYWEFYRELGITDDDVGEMWEAVQLDADRLGFIDDTIPDYLKLLREIGKLDILTMRKEPARDSLVSRLLSVGITRDTHYDNIIFVPTTPKDVKVEYDYDIYIDDSPHLGRSLMGVNDKIMILFDQPWNRMLKCGGNVIRARGWIDVYNIVKKIANKKNKKS